MFGCIFFKLTQEEMLHFYKNNTTKRGVRHCRDVQYGNGTRNKKKNNNRETDFGGSQSNDGPELNGATSSGTVKTKQTREAKILIQNTSTHNFTEVRNISNQIKQNYFFLKLNKELMCVMV